MNIDIGFCSHFVEVLHVLIRAELVEDVDAQFVDEGIIIFVLVQWHPFTADSIGGGIFVVVEQSACTYVMSDNKLIDIVPKNVCDIELSEVRYFVRYRTFKVRYRIRYRR